MLLSKSLAILIIVGVLSNLKRTFLKGTVLVLTRAVPFFYGEKKNDESYFLFFLLMRKKSIAINATEKIAITIM